MQELWLMFFSVRCMLCASEASVTVRDENAGRQRRLTHCAQLARQTVAGVDNDDAMHREQREITQRTPAGTAAMLTDASGDETC
jgi:hypothetical protein